MLSKKNFWSIIFVLALSSPVSNSWALTNPATSDGLNCTTQPTCESLNYSKTADPDCEEGGYVYCPFDSSYMKCVLKKPKVKDVCEGFKMAECPENANCYTCESETATKYTFESCKEGFTHLNNQCVAMHDTCEGAGYKTTNDNGLCLSTTTITLTDGTERTCYSDCCDYVEVGPCETANPNSVCTANEIGCFVASACREGFYKEATDTTCPNGQYSMIGGADANGCGYCATEFATCEDAGFFTSFGDATAACQAAAPEPWPVYLADGKVGACISCGLAWCSENEKSMTRCEEVYANSVCSPDSSGCFKPLACKVGRYKESSGCGSDLGLAASNAAIVKLDGNGCGECQFIEKTCAELSNDMHGVNDLDGLVCASSANINLAGVYSTCHYDCEVKISCQYYDEASCVSENGNSICTESLDGCWGATACKVGFYTEANDVNCPKGTYTKLGGVDANGCGFCATEYESCKAAGFADEPIANGVEHPMYLADGSFERFCMAPATEDACEDAFFNSKCVETEEGEWKADGCKKESATSCPGMSYTDMAGCRTCTLGYENKETCEGANANSVCTEQQDGTFEPTACEAGFSNECQTRVNADKNGCGVCCDFGSETICEKQNANADCTQQNGACWQVTGCADKYKLENGICVASQTCEDFGKISVANKGICSTTAEPENVTLADGTTITCVTCGVGCDYSSEHDCQTKNPNSVCEVNDELCPVVIGCNTGYALVDGTCKKEYYSDDSCEEANPGFVCEFVEGGSYDDGKYVATDECKEGYSLKDGACVANCEYANEGECETTNFNSDCTQVDGCFVPTACNPASLNNFNPNDLSKCMMGGRYHATKLINIDPNGCGRCATDFDTCDQLGYVELPHTSGSEALGAGREFLFLSSRGYPVDCWILDGTCAYGTLEDCQANASGCQYNMGCYEATSCPDGYTLTEGACVRDVIIYSGLEECELANIMNKCEPDGTGKYIPTTCLDGAYADGTCKGVDDYSGDCESDFVSFPCEYDGKGYYVPVNCPRTKAACEAKYIYDNCVKTPEANCWIPNGGKYPAPEASASCTGKNTGAYGMGYAICAETTEKACQTVYPGFNCQLVNDPALGNIYAPMGCKDGYNFENGYCKKIAVPYSTPTACENANPNSTCANTGTSLGYQPNGCKEGYFASEDDCPGDGEGIRDADDAGCGLCEYINYGACYGLGGAYSDYSEEEAVFYGCTDSLTAYIQNKLKTCYTNCVYPHHDVDGSFGECEYADKKVCEAMNEGSTCAKKDGCYVVVNCPAGEYTTDEECSAAYPNSACGPTMDGCFGPDFCATGFTRAGNCPYGTLLNPDAAGCGVCAYTSGVQCSVNSGNFACVSNGNGYYVPTTDSCASGYKLENGGCVPLTCEAGSYSSIAECESQHPGYECEETVDLSSGAQGHSAGSGN